MRKPFHLYLTIVSAIILMLCTHSLYADASKILNTDYTELCNIYNNVVNKPADLTTKEMNLTDDVSKRLPNLFNQLFKHIIKTNADKRYDFIRQYAKQQNNIIWKCESAQLYYINDF